MMGHVWHMHVFSMQLQDDPPHALRLKAGNFFRKGASSGV